MRQSGRVIRPRIRRLWNRLLPNVPLLLRISPGFWWIARNDAGSDMLFEGTYEVAERAFMRRLLTPGMTVIDVGANAGVYALSAAKLVGPAGRVIAFEPSPRERARLGAHLRLNAVKNVTVEPAAIGNLDTDVDLFVVDDVQTGCNSLRPLQADRTRTIRVPMWRLDNYLAQHGVGHVDFVKMDVEGGERDALRGAEQLFQRDRPVLLCEIEETRIRPWGYEPREIFDLVAAWNYRWFAVARGGELVPLTADPPPPGNYVARPG